MSAYIDLSKWNEQRIERNLRRRAWFYYLSNLYDQLKALYRNWKQFLQSAARALQVNRFSQITLAAGIQKLEAWKASLLNPPTIRETLMRTFIIQRDFIPAPRPEPEPPQPKPPQPEPRPIQLKLGEPPPAHNATAMLTALTPAPITTHPRLQIRLYPEDLKALEKHLKGSKGRQLAIRHMDDGKDKWIEFIEIWNYGIIEGIFRIPAHIISADSQSLQEPAYTSSQTFKNYLKLSDSQPHTLALYPDCIRLIAADATEKATFYPPDITPTIPARQTFSPLAQVNTADFLQAWNAAQRFAAGKDEYREVLQGIRIETHDNVLKFIAANGYTLGIFHIPADIEVTGAAYLVYHKPLKESELLNELSINASESGDLEIVSGGTVIPLESIPGIFPDYNQVIPRQSKFLAESACLYDIQRALMKLKATTAVSVKLSFERGGVELKTVSQEKGESIQFVDYAINEHIAHATGDERELLTIHLNHRYLQHATGLYKQKASRGSKLRKHLKTMPALIGINGSKAPMTLQWRDGSMNATAIFMPCSIQ